MGQGNDLFDTETTQMLEFRVKKSSTLRDFMSMLAEEMKFPVDRMRPWPLNRCTEFFYWAAVFLSELWNNLDMPLLIDKGLYFGTYSRLD